MSDTFDGGALADDVARHDAAVRALGLEAWIGAEPTFTRRTSEEPWWLYAAEGGDKEAWARRLLVSLAPRLDAPAALVRAVGRHYPEEDAPRFCLGAAWSRDGRPAGPGPGLPAGAAGLDGPPVPPPAPDPGLAWLTVTPDPAVVEVNLAPAPDLAAFARYAAQVYAAAAEAGLDPVRFRYNGEATDSGGGGQLTFGGPTPAASPFFRHPRLLPGLLRYLNHHPSLSFAFAGECVGSASQGPRPDEGVRERLDELAVTLDRLDATPAARLEPDLLWRALAPLLVDASGNSHRAEVNIEKLWSPHLAGRGRLGLVELRSLGMPPTPARLVAVAALFRALLARLVADPFTAALVDRGPALHDRFGLPTFLKADLDEVLDDLAAHGVGLGPALRAALAPWPDPLCAVTLGGARLTLTPGVEFWPLVGDVASQETRGARLVDSSLRRLEARVDGEPAGTLLAAGRAASFRAVAPGVYVAGLRYRAYAPSPGFLPDLPPHDPLDLVWRVRDEALAIRLHQWRPDGGAYDGLPADAAEAAARRRARLSVRPVPPPDLAAAPARYGPGARLTLDLRAPAADPLPGSLP